MNNFISYNQYKNNLVLNETYESYVELKILAKEIVDGYKRDFDIKGTRGIFRSSFKRDKIYHLNKFVKHNYKVIKDFVNSKLGVLYAYELPEMSVNGMYLRSANNYEDYTILEKNFDSEYLIKNFPDGVIAMIKKLNEETVIHELQHAYDDFRAQGKLLNTKLGRRLEKQNDTINQIKDEKQRKEFYNKQYLNTYYRTPHEMSGYFVKVLDKMNFFTDESEMYLRDFKDLYEEFIENFQGYERLTPKDKKMLARKFSQYYYKLKERNIYDE
jgi:hypothetical protein